MKPHEAAAVANRRHGHASQNNHSREYRAWANAKTRCFNSSTEYYKNYGGRGITMCDEWRDDFAVFLRDMGPCPAGLWLDRKDNDGPYAQWNCQWVTPTTQLRNTRRNVRHEWNGLALTVPEWAERTGLSIQTIGKRIRSGWPLSDVLTLPMRAGRPYRVMKRLEIGHKQGA